MSTYILKNGDQGPGAAKLREILGFGMYERVMVQTPQFGRTDDREIWFYPKLESDFDKIKELEPQMLYEIGMIPFGNMLGGKLWLYPGEWYDYIPDGYKITTIFGDVESFRKGKTDNDIRYGALAYGFVKKEAES